ncbi:MAG: CAP domain-containing protein [Candidatus Peribacteria bacterium]|nr:CAP domain-containing protein [Candidatus Peribacteria bacterium]
MYASTTSAMAAVVISTVDKAVAKKGTSSEKIRVFKAYQALFGSSKFSKSKNQKIYAVVITHIQEELVKLQSAGETDSSQSAEKPAVPNISLDLPHVNVQKVRDTVLSWHNGERTSVGVSPYGYSSDFEATAQTWATYLKDTATTNNTHVRTAGDGYYNYDKITAWFAGLGIEFPVLTGGRASFSESVGRGYYTCKSSDCTENLITAIRTTRDDLFMKEKPSNGSHYRAVVMSHFTQVGVGISIDPVKKRYYMVVHYGVDPK